MTTIYFVRHAHSVYSSDEYGRGVSEHGKEEAERVTECFQQVHVDIVLSSPYRRAIDTVEGIAESKGLEVRTVENLKERTLSDSPVEDFNSAINKVWSVPTFSFPGGESNAQAQHRGISTIRHLLNMYEGKHMVIGTHGNIMVLIMHHFDRQYGIDFWKQLTMPDIYKVTFNQQNLIKVERIWKE
ncbi:histidine phosphatase family protein [Alkalihalobacillus sp. TS-13]|uniref:histidine phosphatase family protein n=1 Tax=Alkalihalobacillus sp. TS-13 TaxID=2842455 RepID=UPI001C880360|nr:histidine phosphatase family protein [Alkalihalobacillus sp. TS-13]